jgi:hypothetical protein
MSLLQISVFYTDEDLPDYYSLSDVAELYSWRRVSVITIHYNLSDGVRAYMCVCACESLVPVCAVSGSRM